MLDKKVFGLRLREIREAKQISRKEVAELLHVTKTQISDMENGKSGTNLDRLYLLCNYYKVSSDYLLGITDDPACRGAQCAPAVHRHGVCSETQAHFLF